MSDKLTQVDLAEAALRVIANFSYREQNKSGLGSCADWLMQFAGYHEHYINRFFEKPEWEQIAALRYEVAEAALNRVNFYDIRAALRELDAMQKQHSTLIQRTEALEGALRRIAQKARLSSDPVRAHTCQIDYDELLSSLHRLAREAENALAGGTAADLFAEMDAEDEGDE